MLVEIMDKFTWRVFPIDRTGKVADIDFPSLEKVGHSHKFDLERLCVVPITEAELPQVVEWHDKNVEKRNIHNEIESMQSFLGLDTDVDSVDLADTEKIKALLQKRRALRAELTEKQKQVREKEDAWHAN